ncbi:MAG: hypothetical protein ACFFF4_01840 [Candidatus Thorarchaeota archaeon]
MLDKIRKLSIEASERNRKNPDTAERMHEAEKGQTPRFLVISPINRSAQDLQLFQFGQGDAFHATRVPGFPLLSPELSTHLFAAPAAYNHQFPNRTGVIITFEKDELPENIRESVESVAKHPDIDDIPIIALRVDYDTARVRLVPHRFGRAYELENYILKRLSRPDVLDTNTLIVICSDSRLIPPTTPKGVPMAIQTLGAHIPHYDENSEESVQLNEFFKNWLSNETIERRIIVVVHGNFEGDGHSCGAGYASLHPDIVQGSFLERIVEELNEDAAQVESHQPGSPEERVIAIGTATLKNIKTYPGVQEAIKRGADHEEFLRVLEMDTVTNVVSPYEIGSL